MISTLGVNLMDNVRKLGLTGASLVAFGANLSAVSFLIGIFTNLPYLFVLYVAGIYIDFGGGGILSLWVIIWLVLNGRAGKRKGVDGSE